MNNLHRFLKPQSLAIVGASENNAALKGLIEDAEAAHVEVSLVNPRRSEVFGRAAVPSLRDLGKSVDTVLSLVNADIAATVVEEAAAVGAAGVVITAALFGEAGHAGEERQAALKRVARGAELEICGPNCLGYIDTNRGFRAYSGLRTETRKGPVSLVSQSGGILASLVFGAAERLMGMSYLISSGNEAVTDMTAYLDFLVDDPDTTAIGLVIEEIRRPLQFLETVERARQAGKAIIALKVGRSERGQLIGHSHTGALMADARIYDVAFKQFGIGIATDPDDLLDQLQLFAHQPRSTWVGGQNIAVVGPSGGNAGLASDDFEAAGLPLPEDPEIRDRVRASIPGSTVMNPLDVTGLNYNEAAFGEILSWLDKSPVYDTLLVIGNVDQEAHARPVVAPLLRFANSSTKRLIVASYMSGHLTPWLTKLLDEGICVGRGVRATTRSLAAMDRFVAASSRRRAPSVDPIPVPEQATFVESPDGALLSFADTMELLTANHIPVAPYAVWPEGQQVPQLWTGAGTGPFVVKLADVLHRTELGAVFRNVAIDDLGSHAERLREIARKGGYPTTVVVQAQVQPLGEVFAGIQGDSTFGPLVLFGMGGIFVEVLNDVAMRIAPVTTDDAQDMLSELASAKLMRGVRGGQAWDREALVDVILRVGKLAAAAGSWINSLDINPIIVSANGPVAVDASLLRRPA